MYPFMKADEQWNPLQNRHCFNLLKIDMNDKSLQPHALDLDEIIGPIVQSHKTGRIYYASHKDNFKNVNIRELI